MSRTLPTSWDTVVLVCKACQKRGSGPKKLKGKEVALELRRDLKGVPSRPRVVMTSCMGLCPKGAIAVAVAGNGVTTQATAIEDLEQAKGVSKVFDTHR